MKRFLRFRDDVSLHISGSNNEIRDVLNIIITGYPPEIQFNVESNIIWGKFLNIRIFNDPSSLIPCNFKYDIIPFNSNVPHHFKLMAGRSYFRTARSHTNSTFELKNQLEVVNTILKLKGFPIRLINRMKSHTITSLSKNDSAKQFLRTSTFDKIGRVSFHLL